MTITDNPPEVQENAEPAAATAPERRPAPCPGLAGLVHDGRSQAHRAAVRRSLASSSSAAGW